MRRRSLNILAVLTVLVGVPFAASGAEQQLMHVSTLLETDPPMSIAEKVLGEAYKRLGIRLEVHKYPGERSLQSANSGQMDGELYRRAGMERDYPNLMQVPVPLQVYEIVVFTRDSALSISAWDELSSLTIGYVRGIEIIEANTKGMRTEPVPTLQQALQKLMVGRTDVVVGNRVSGLAAIKALKLDKVRVLQPALASFPVYHYLNRKHAALIPRLTAVLQQMQQEKVIERIQREVLAQQPATEPASNEHE